jgi:tRNA(adenine34) deaminase
VISDLEAMRLALIEAARAEAHGDVPVGAVVVVENEVVASRHNERERLKDPLAHAEVLALRDAANALGADRAREASLFVTLEPCVMCAGAIREFGVARVVFGAADLRVGGCGSRYDVLGDTRLGPGPRLVSGILAGESAALLRTFFAGRRNPVNDVKAKGPLR